MTTTEELLNEAHKLLWGSAVYISDVADDLLETAPHLMEDLVTVDRVVAVKEIAKVYVGIKSKYQV